MGFREVWQNKYVRAVREECCIGDEEKYHNVIEKHMLLAIAINLRETRLIIVRADRDDVFKNVSHRRLWDYQFPILTNRESS